MIQNINVLTKTVTIVHTEDETSFAYFQNGNLVKYKILATSNNKEIKQILVEYCKRIYDGENNEIRSEPLQYRILNASEYLFFYRLEGQQGFTQYMHALNGAFSRCLELGGTLDGSGGVRPFNVDGTIKDLYL